LNIKKILVVGQTPPPYGGQAMMINRLVTATFTKIKIYHLRMSYSESFKKIGRVNFSKVVHLLCIILKTYILKYKHNIKTLYYPPAGPNLAPVARDTIFLLLVRPLFKEVIFHFRAAGVSEYVEKLNPFLQLFVYKAYSYADIAIQLSFRNPEDGKYFHSKRIEVIPNGIEDENTSNLIKATNNEIHLIFIGVIQKSKGIEDVLLALDTVIKKYTNVVLDVLGEFNSATYEHYIKNIIFKYNLQKNVFFHGVIVGEEKKHFLTQADILCFPSYFESESFGNVLLEAMQFNLPVVATEWRGIPDIVIDSVTGFLVPIKSPQQIAEKLLLLINNSTLRIKLGENARNRYLSHYTLNTHLDNMENILSDVVI
jgi:glycosyltransferase involved in cell wall biosynthesis